MDEKDLEFLNDTNMDDLDLWILNHTNQSTSSRRIRRLLNLTLHDATPELHAMGVVDPWSEPSAEMKAFYETSRGNYANKRRDLMTAIHYGNWTNFRPWTSLFRRDMVNEAYQRSKHCTTGFYLKHLARIARAQGALYAWVEEEYEALPKLLSELEACEITPVFLRKEASQQAEGEACSKDASAYIFVEARPPHNVVEGPFEVNNWDLEGVGFPEGTVFDDALKCVPQPERCQMDIEEEEKMLKK